MRSTHLIYGKHTILLAMQYQSQLISKIYMTSSKNNEEILILAKQLDIDTESISLKQIDKLFPQQVHQNVLAELHQWPYKPEQQLIDIIFSKESPFILILDQIQDPQNLGACLRSASAFNVDAVIFSKKNTAGLNASSMKASAGLASMLSIFRVSNLARVIKQLKFKGMWFVGMHQLSDHNISEINVSGALGLVMGAEGNGLRFQIQNICDYLVHIPMNYYVDSLNVSVAAGIAMYDIHRRRN